jgi:hypothetical protein
VQFDSDWCRQAQTGPFSSEFSASFGLVADPWSLASSVPSASPT